MVDNEKNQIVPQQARYNEQLNNNTNTSQQQRVDLTFNNLKYTVKTKKGDKVILRSLSGVCKSGTVTAILGSSGAGKTTLLNILSKRIENSSKTKIEGQVLANNQPYNSDQFSQFASYVMQNDILTETLTVREQLQFAANLKIEGSQQDKEKKVNEMIKKMKLDKCKDSYIGGNFVKGISGGEKKRTSIGFELVSDPTCILLDEPTSGLDSFTAYLLIYELVNYAHENNKTVVFTIHQPSSDIWNLFDNIMLMVEGQLIYQGPGKNDIINYFNNIGFKCPQLSNPGDYFMSIMHISSEVNKKNFNLYFDKYKSQLEEGIKQQIELSSKEIIKKKSAHTTLAYQFQQLSYRQINFIKRNPIVFKARLIQTIIIGLFTGAIFWQIPNVNPTQRDINNKNGFFFFFSVGMFMMSLNPCILTFPAEKVVYLKEQGANLYSLGPYFLSKFFIEVIPTLFQCILSALIQYWMVGLNDSSPKQVLTFILISMVQGACGLGLGYLGSSAFNDSHTAMAITPMLIMPFMLFSGFYKNRSNYQDWIGWIEYLSPFRYSFEALSTNEYQAYNYKFNPLDQLGFELGLWQSFGCQFTLFVGFTCLAYIFLSTLKKKIQ